VLELVDVSKSFGSRALLNKVSIRIGEQERVGLVGANGSGKTTLFRIMAGEEQPDSGLVQGKKGLTIGFLPQEIDVKKEGCVIEEVLSVLPAYFETRQELERVERELASGWEAEHLLKRKLDLILKLEQLGGAGIEAKAQEILTGLGFGRDEFVRPLATLSGGWHMRTRLARLLMARPDLLLLDEPTNHLDLPSIVWFEQYLKGFDGAYVIVAHDREFLNRTVTRVMEADGGAVIHYSGDYDFYRKRKEEDREIKLKAFRTQQVKLREVEDFVARNRVRKDRARQVQSRLKMLERVELLEAPKEEKQINFRFPQPVRSGQQVISLLGLAKRFDRKVVFDGVDLVVTRGEKVALIGVNGMGKSTLLKIAAGSLPFEGGERGLGHNVTVGYYAQHQLEALTGGFTVLQEIYTVARDESVSEIRSLLGAFLFSGEEVEKKVSVLSGGEKSRLALAKLLLRPANFIVMDEPTNHLDIVSREVLEEALRQYTGTLLFSAHDRRFIDAVATRVIEVNSGRLIEYAGNYSYYDWKKRQQPEPAGAPGMKRGLPPADGDGDGDGDGDSGPSMRELRKERKRREAELRNDLYRKVKPLRERAGRLEAEISELEKRVAAVEMELADPSLYSAFPERVREKSVLLVASRRDLEDRLDEWEAVTLEAEAAESTLREQFGDLQEGEKNA
jgi:ATP-binding cassette subfamily F protein 3